MILRMLEKLKQSFVFGLIIIKVNTDFFERVKKLFNDIKDFLLKKKKKKQQQYGHERYKNLPENEKQKLIECRKYDF